MSDRDLTLDEAMDPRIAVLVVWCVFFFFFVIFPSICIRILGCCGPASDALPDGLTEEERRLFEEGLGSGWDRYMFLSLQKRNEIDELRRGVLRRYLGRCSVELGGEHMVCLSEGTVVDDGKEEGAILSSDGDDAAVGLTERDDGSFVTALCQIPVNRDDMANPHDYIHCADDDDEEAQAKPSNTQACPDDFIQYDEGASPSVASSGDPPKENESPSSSQQEEKEEEEAPSSDSDKRSSKASDALASFEDASETAEHTHVRIPLPGHYSDGTEIEEKESSCAEGGDADANNNNNNNNGPWRLSLTPFRNKVQVASSDDPTERGKDGEGTFANDDDDDGGGVPDRQPVDPPPPRRTDERRNVPAFCAICLGEYAPNETVSWSSNPRCTHVFHQDCIVQWLTTLGRRSAKRQRLPSFAGGEEEDSESYGLQLLDYGLECPCCRQDFICKANVVVLAEEGEEDGEITPREWTMRMFEVGV